jgi:hypothetical protein
MKSLPDLDRLSVAEKDDLIEMLLAACQEVESGGGPLPHDRIAHLFHALTLTFQGHVTPASFGLAQQLSMALSRMT